MRRVIARRLVASVFSLLIASFLIFALPRIVSDPLDMFAKPDGYGISTETREYLTKSLGLDRPLVVQYWIWLRNTLTGQLGRSVDNNRLVTTIIGEKVGATVQLGIVAWIFATLVGVPLGVVSAIRRGSTVDYLARGFALVGQAAPAFWIAILGILLFSVKFGLLPVATRGAGLPFTEQWTYYVLPTIVLGWHPAAAYTRITRSAMLEILDSEFVVLARAKGVSNSMVIWKHAFRNALIQPLTLSALILAGFITGTVIVESVFSWPGLGRLAIDAVFDNDFPILTAVVLLFMVAYVGMNMLADFLMVLIDPRVRL